MRTRTAQRQAAAAKAQALVVAAIEGLGEANTLTQGLLSEMEHIAERTLERFAHTKWHQAVEVAADDLSGVTCAIDLALENLRNAHQDLHGVDLQVWRYGTSG